MTPAMQAMVAAMVDEFRAQATANRQYADGAGSHTRFGLEGVFNLEKVARAGLEALEDADEHVDLSMCTADGAWSQVLDAILKDQP